MLDTGARQTACPSCGGATKRQARRLAVLLDPGYTTSVKITCRYCPKDDLLMAPLLGLEEGLIAALEHDHADLIGNEFLVTGLIDDDALRHKPKGPLDADWIAEHTTRFREPRQIVSDGEEQLLEMMDAIGDPSSDLGQQLLADLERYSQ